jgi:predicted phage terminase large subunit-like protein
MKETLSTRKVDKGVSVTILIMQRLHEIDPTGDWIKRATKEDLKHINLPAELSETVEPPELKERYVDGLLDPIRLSKKILEQQKRDLGEFGYACQFDQTPIPRGGGEFKTSQIQVELAPPGKWLRRVRYWDKAGTKDGGCYTAGVLLGMDRFKNVWILDVKRGQWDAFEREQIIKQAAEVDGDLVSVYVEQEPGSGGKESAQSTIRNLMGHKIYADRPTGNKQARAYPFACSVNGGMVHMIKGEWNYAYINELMHWPISAFKDQVDASSGAFNHLAKPKRKAGGMNLDESKSVESE